MVGLALLSSKKFEKEGLTVSTGNLRESPSSFIVILNPPKEHSGKTSQTHIPFDKDHGIFNFSITFLNL